MVEVRQAKSEAQKIAERLLNSGDVKNADVSVKHGDGPTRTHTQISSSRSSAWPGYEPDDRQRSYGRWRGSRVMKSDQERIVQLERQLKEVLEAIERDRPKPYEPPKVSDWPRYDPTENMSLSPRTREEMPEWMRGMVDANTYSAADARSDRVARPDPSLAGAGAGGEDRAPVVGSRHDKGRG